MNTYNLKPNTVISIVETIKCKTLIPLWYDAWDLLLHHNENGFKSDLAPVMAQPMAPPIQLWLFGRAGPCGGLRNKLAVQLQAPKSTYIHTNLRCIVPIEKINKRAHYHLHKHVHTLLREQAQLEDRYNEV